MAEYCVGFLHNTHVLSSNLALSLSHFLLVKTAKHLKRIIFQQILAKVGAVVYEYYKNAFVERCEKETFKAYGFDSRQAKR